jgi:hypothetical protein
MNKSKIKADVGRLLAGSPILRHGARVFLRIRTAISPRSVPFVAVLSMGEKMHAYSAARGVKALGRRVLLITDTPQLPEMAYSDAILLRNPLTDAEAILAELETFKLDGVLVSTDHVLLPLQDQIASRFDLISVGAETTVFNNDKLAWRNALAAEGVPQPGYSSNPAVFDGKACVRKPRSGHGSKDVVALKAEDDKHPYAGEKYYFEEVMAGDQYEYEGIVRNGQVHIFARLFEKYREHNGTFVSQYYFFNLPIDPEIDAALEACARKTLAVARVRHGAFHIEMRMNGTHAVPIDFANRISSVERGVSFCMNDSYAKAHASCFVFDKQSLPVPETRPLFQYWCWTEDEFGRASAIRDANSDRVFEARMVPHRMNGEQCFGMVTFFHDDARQLLEMTESLAI